jgi:hypothetical protein
MHIECTSLEVKMFEAKVVGKNENQNLCSVYFSDMFGFWTKPE